MKYTLKKLLLEIKLFKNTTLYKYLIYILGNRINII